MEVQWPVEVPVQKVVQLKQEVEVQQDVHWTDLDYSTIFLCTKPVRYRYSSIYRTYDPALVLKSSHLIVQLYR